MLIMDFGLTSGLEFESDTGTSPEPRGRSEPGVGGGGRGEKLETVGSAGPRKKMGFSANPVCPASSMRELGKDACLPPSLVSLGVCRHPRVPSRSFLVCRADCSRGLQTTWFSCFGILTPRAGSGSTPALCCGEGGVPVALRESLRVALSQSTEPLLWEVVKSSPGNEHFCSGCQGLLCAADRSGCNSAGTYRVPRIRCTLAASSDDPPDPCHRVMVGIQKLRGCEPHGRFSRWGLEKPGLVSRLPDPRARGRR